MEVLETHANQRYIQVSDPLEIDGFRINEVGGERFTFLKNLGILDYKETFKVWLRKFPRPVFVICVEDKNIIAWVYVEEWDSVAKDGSPVYVLRSIETAEERRGSKIGFRLLLIVAKQTPGYLITKPINESAREFFLSNYFLDKEKIENPPIYLHSNPGYLILPPYRKKKLLEEYDYYFNSY